MKTRVPEVCLIEIKWFAPVSLSVIGLGSSMETMERQSVPNEVGGGLRQFRGAVHIDPVPGTVALRNERE